MNNSKIQIFRLFSSLLILLSFSCVKEENQSVPSVYVNFTINIKTDPEFYKLQAQGNTIIIEDYTIGTESMGYDNNGMAVYNAAGSEFYAFDCTCPYDLPLKSIAVELYATGMLKCSECGSVYVLGSSGMPTVKGPAVLPLREYPAYYTANGDIHVHN